MGICIHIEEHIGLVRMCIGKFTGKGIEYDDLFQAGCMGLVKASENFDHSRGLQFSTYAVPVILGEIKGLFRTGRPLKVSRTVRELAKRIQDESERLQLLKGEAPSVSELAKNLEISIEKVAMGLGAGKMPISLSGSDETEEIEIPVEAMEEKMTEKLTLYQILKSLPEEDQSLIRCRYYQSKTQQQTAEVLNMTQVQVSRREKKILIYMRSLL